MLSIGLHLLPRLVVLGALAYGGHLAYLFLEEELRTYEIQARELSRIAGQLTYRLDEGPSFSVRFPQSGPYDRRLGYAQMPQWIEQLAGRGFHVAAQARISDRFHQVLDWGLFSIYREKTQTGLRILDRNERAIFDVRYPERMYLSLDHVPRMVAETLLYIENRELLDLAQPRRNPAVEWDRLGKVVLDMAGGLGRQGRRPSGGSTIATQLEKYRHSPEGRTASVGEKLRQMASAALRAYLDGEDTTEARRRILLDYINSIPLAALPGYGEVNGLGDGLWAWFGSEFQEVNRLLREEPDPLRPVEPRARALAYRKVLSLLLAHRRPSHYLLADQDALHALTDSYLRLLMGAGIIPEALGAEALALRPEVRVSASVRPPASFLERKGVNSVRTALLMTLGMERLYDLDRLDLAIKSSLDHPMQETLTRALIRLREPAAAEAAGLMGARLLSRGDLARVIYSFTLYERTDGGNLLRIQTDNFDGPFNINEGMKLDLGSTAKLRTLVSYLEIVAELHRRLGGLSRAELAGITAAPSDRLTQWAIEYLCAARDRGLGAMLQAALQRTYSASAAEEFFTGGGMHTFANFNRDDNERFLTVRDGFLHSVNLVFIRLMRDIVHYYMYRVAGSTARIVAEMNEEERSAYLSRFADKEGREFLTRFYRKYRKKGSDEALNLLLQGIHATPKRLAVVYRTVRPSAPLEVFSAFMRARLPDAALPEKLLRELYATHAPDRFSLADRGFLAHVHPLELWTVAYLTEHPGAGLSELVQASASERQAVYRWLFARGQRQAQDQRIRTMREVEAFQEIHRAWRRLGYPFGSLVPSYATAIGSSSDNPAALAELVGIISNHGVRYPTHRLEWLHFAEGTPYETLMTRRVASGEQVLPREVADAVRQCLVDVVENGTARRGRGAFRRSDGTVLPLGGKTGTGDNRYEVHGPGGQVTKARVMSRTATFVFFVGERFFGTVTAFVPGQEAALYDFTSALPVQLLKSLAPLLMPMVDAPAKGSDPTAERLASGYAVFRGEVTAGGYGRRGPGGP
jgi:membrane peptidoglycan carboxypeptidase